MALRIADTMLTIAIICQFKGNVRNIPILVPRLLEQFDPHVWNRHRQPEAEPYASFFDRSAKAREARHIFSN